MTSHSRIPRIFAVAFLALALPAGAKTRPITGKVNKPGYGVIALGYNGKAAVIISIQKQPTADTVMLTRKIEAALQDIQRTLPAGISATNVQFRQATFIETSIHNVERVLLEAAAVVAVVLFVFLMNARATFVSLTAIPISVLITVLVFNLFGLTINTMTLGGLAIAIGELVDDAVVGVENILRRLRENRALASPRPAFEVIASATQEVRSGIVYATIIIVLFLVTILMAMGSYGAYKLRERRRPVAPPPETGGESVFFERVNAASLDVDQSDPASRV